MDLTPLLVTTNVQLIAHVRELATAGGRQIDIAGHVEEVRAQWQERALVLVGDDCCEGLIGLPKRRDVSILLWQPVMTGEAPATVWQSALALGADQLVRLPEADAWLAELLTQADPGQQADGQLLAVTGASGGSGASSVALGLAAAISKRGRRALLIDGDAAGGGLDLLLGAEGQAGSRWPDLADVSGRLSPSSVLPGLPTAHGIALVSSARHALVEPSPEAWASLLDFGRRNFDVVIVDLPRHRALVGHEWWPRDLQCELWCVVPTRIRSISAAAAMWECLEKSWAQVAVIARQTERGVAPGDLGRALGREVLASLPHDNAVAAAGELGELCGGAFAKACAHLAAVGLRP